MRMAKTAILNPTASTNVVENEPSSFVSFSLATWFVSEVACSSDDNTPDGGSINVGASVSAVTG